MMYAARLHHINELQSLHRFIQQQHAKLIVLTAYPCLLRAGSIFLQLRLQLLNLAIKQTVGFSYCLYLQGNKFSKFSN